jgi:hypothetical protein
LESLAKFIIEREMWYKWESNRIRWVGLRIGKC